MPLVLREEHADLYGSPVLQEGVTAIATTPYNPALNPVIGSLNAATTAAEQTYIINSWQSLDIAITGTATTITISNHSRICGQDCCCDRGNMTGRTNATTYYLITMMQQWRRCHRGTSTSYATASIARQPGIMRQIHRRGAIGYGVRLPAATLPAARGGKT